MLASKPVDVLHIMSPQETIPHDEVIIADRVRLLSLEESRQPTLPELKTKLLHELVRAASKMFQNAATRLVRVHRAQLVNSTDPWISEREFVWELLDIADLKSLTSAFTKMVAPSSKGLLPFD